LLFHERKVLFTPEIYSPFLFLPSKHIVMYFASGKMTSIGEKATLPAKETTLTVNRPESLRVWSSGCKMRHMKTITKVI